MNKTAAFVIFGILAALGLTGTIILLLFRPDTTAVFTAFVVQTLSLVAVAAGTFYGLGKANEKLAVVEKQTNGTLSRLVEENDRLTRQNIDLAKQIHPPKEGDSDA